MEDKNKWRIKEYIQGIYVGVVKIRRLRWLGHIKRRGEYTMIKQILNGTLEGRRPFREPDNTLGRRGEEIPKEDGNRDRVGRGQKSM